MSSNFLIDWHKLNITKKGINVNTGIKIDTKRQPVYNNDLWVNTIPKEVNDELEQFMESILI